MEPTTPDARLLIEHREFLRRLAGRLVRDEHAAEDVTQEVYVRALEHPPEPGNLRGWLGRVARNLSISRLRSEQRRARRERTVPGPKPLPPVDESVGRIELQQRVVAVVLDLPEPYRSTLVHRFFHDLEPMEIAARSGVPRETVKTRLRRALEMVRARLDEEHHGDRRGWSVLLLPFLPKGEGGVAAAITGGAFIVGTKLKIVAAVLILAIFAGLGLLTALRSTDRPADPEPPAAAAEIAIASDAVVEPPALGPAIDLTTVDRDRDLHGTVVDEEGRPVGGAEILAVRYPFRRILVPTQAALARVAGPATRSAADGTFALRLERGEKVDLEIRAPDSAPVVRSDCLAGERVRIVLRGGTPLTIRTVNGVGEPIEGVHLVFFDFGMRGGDADGGAWLPPEGITGTDGRCIIERTVPRSDLALIAWHEGYGLERVGSFRIPESGEFEVVLEAGRPVTGTVRDATTGRAVAGATITTVPIFTWFSVETDEEGRFTWPAWRGGFSEGLSALFVSAEGYPFTQREVHAEDDLEILLEPGGRIEGRLVGPDGEPVAGGLVTTLGGAKSEIDHHDGRSDPDGRFALTGLSLRVPHTLISLAPGYGRTLLDLDPPPAAGEVLRLGDLVLPLGRRIEGRLLDGAAAPIPHESVALTGANADRGRLRPGERPLDTRYGTRERCVTDDLGRFRFRDLAPGTYELSVRPQRGMAVSRTVRLANGTDVLDADLRPEADNRFSVRVTDEKGDPVSGASVTLYLPSGRPTGRTAADGWAHLDVPAAAREAMMVVHPPEGRSLLALSRSQRLTRDGTSVVLEASGTVAGSVLDPEGELLPHAVVVATWGEVGSQAVAADATGRFRVEVPAKERIELSLNGQVGRERRPIIGRVADVAAGTTDVVLRAREIDMDRTLRVRVLTPGGEPVTGIRLWVAGSRSSPVTDEFGIAEISDLPAKEVFVTVSPAQLHKACERWAVPERLLVVPAGQEVLLRFREATTVSGTVRLPDGSPAHVVVVARERAGRLVAQTVTSPADGTFDLRIPADQPGALTLEVNPSTNHREPSYRELRDVRIPNVLPRATGIDILLERRD